MIGPSDWMPIIFDEKEAGYASLEEAKAILGELMAMYNDINAAVVENRSVLPTDCVFRDEALANLEDGAPIAQWSRGVLTGHQWLEESWDPYIPKELDEEFGTTLMALSFFASKSLAEAFWKDLQTKSPRVEPSGF